MDTDTARPGLETRRPALLPPREEPRRGLGPELRRFVANPLLMLIVVGIIAAVPRFMHLSHPNERIFDETYYAKDGCLYAGFDYRQCELETPDEQSWVHPPLGKWMIAPGIKWFGYNPYGWRFSAAAVGTATVMLIALTAYLLFGSALWGYAAGVLGATESLLFVQSRVALLDIFLAFWVVVGFLFLVLDRRWIHRRDPRPSPYPAPPPESPPEPEPAPPDEPLLEPEPAASAPPPDEPTRARHRHLLRPPPPRVRVASPLWRPWLCAAGAAFGLAGAVKWSAAPALAGAIGLYVVWEIARRRDIGVPTRTVGLRLLRVAVGFAAGFGFALLIQEEVTPIIPIVIIALVAVILVVAEVRLREGTAARMTPAQLAWAAGTGTAIAVTGFVVGLVTAGELQSGTSRLLGAGALAGMLIIVALRERSRRLDGQTKSPLWATVQRESLTVVVALVVLPLVVYLGSFFGEIRDDDYPKRRYYPGLGLAAVQAPLDLLAIHLQAADFHDGLLAVDQSKDDKKAHPYQSRPWEWIWLGRPVAYYYETLNEKKPNEKRQEVLGIGNPAVFWGGMVAIPWLGVALTRRRDWVAGFVLTAFLAQWLFWFIPGISLQKVQFFFYATPLAPFLVLAVTYVLRDLSRIRLAGSRSRPFLPVAVGWVGLAVGLFAFFWPVLTGAGLSPDSWQARIWSGDWV